MAPLSERAVLQRGRQQPSNVLKQEKSWLQRPDQLEVIVNDIPVRVRDCLPQSGGAEGLARGAPSEKERFPWLKVSLPHE
jgi:hypothetical protein